MLKLNFQNRRNGGKHELRATILYVHASATPEKIQEVLGVVKNQLEQAIPTSLRAKYVVNREGLVMRIQCASAAVANQQGRRVEEMLNHFLKNVRV